MPKLIDCPNCSKKLLWNVANPFRPFCSERCKMIDLGEWADEKYRIASHAAAKNEKEE